jgi:DNA-binding transcriptional MerR regulator
MSTLLALPKRPGPLLVQCSAASAISAGVSVRQPAFPRARPENMSGFAQLCIVYLSNSRSAVYVSQRLRRPFPCMRYLKTSEAAALLNVSPNTLRAWERRFGFPKPQRSPGKHRLFTHGEVAALRDALQEGLSISSAVSRAREGLAADSNSLVGALVSYERERADAAIEAALALRSVERSVSDVLLPTLDEIARRYTVDSAAWAFAAHWGADWLRRAQRLAPPPVRPVSIVVGDASRDELDPDAPHIRALELFCVRAGVRVLSLSARGVAGIGDALAVHRPNLVVLAGGHLGDDAVARWAYAVRLAAGALPVAVYRRGGQRVRMRTTTSTGVLPANATEAQRRILELVEVERAKPAVAIAPAPRQPGELPGSARTATL